MVVDKDMIEGQLDRIFRALSDGTRRDIISRVLQGPQSVTELASRYDMTFAAVQKHVAVLEDAGLVSKRAQGRERLVLGQVETINKVQKYLAQFEKIWRQRFAQLDALLAEEPEES